MTARIARFSAAMVLVLVLGATGSTSLASGSAASSDEKTPQVSLTEPACTILGTKRSDDLMGTDGDDVICGKGGGDVIMGLGGNDTVRGGPGHDIIRGGLGDDALYGDKGDDRIFGEAGYDALAGGVSILASAFDDGNDVLKGGPADDGCLQGADSVSGNDKVIGNAGFDNAQVDDGDVMEAELDCS